MAWNVEIQLRDNKSAVIQNLTSINTQSDYDSSIAALTEFNKFYLINNQRLSFLSDAQVFSINSSDILSVSFHKI